MKNHIGISVWLLILFGIASSFNDQNIKCPKDQRLTSITRTGGKNKKIEALCSPFSPSVNDISCSTGKALKCDGQFEGCEDPNAWIGGFQVFDVDAGAEMYVPYCCTSPKMSLDRSKCQKTPKMNGNVNYETEPTASLSRVSCQYVRENNKNKDMIFEFEECNNAPGGVKVTTTSTVPTTINIRPITTEAPAKVIVPTPSNQKSIPPVIPIVPITPAGPLVDPNLCFSRLVVRNKALDYLEDSPPLNVISTVRVSDVKDCAKKCYNSEKELGRRCRSFRFSASNCALRENYVNGKKVQTLPTPIDATYGNWTSADCSGR